MATIQNQNKGQPAEHEIQSPPGMIQPVFNGNESQSDLTQRTVLRVHGDLVPIRFKILYHIWLSTPQPAQDPYRNPLEPEVGHALTYGHKHGHLSWSVIKASQWAHESKWPVTVVSQSGWSDLAERMAKDGARCEYTIQPTMQDPRPDVFPHLVDLPTYISPCDGPFGSGGRQPLIDIHVLYRVYINICTDDRSGEMLCHQVDSKFSSDSLTLQFELLKLDDLKSASIIHLKREHGPYPIAEIIQTACASTTSEVLWHYKLREPNQPPNRGSFMPGLGGSFAAFHSAAMLSTEEAKISVRIIMQKDQECCTVTKRKSDQPAEWSMTEFLVHCHIPSHYRPVQEVLAKHEILHWSAFKGTSLETLKSLGLGWGPARLIHIGVLQMKAPVVLSDKLVIDDFLQLCHICVNHQPVQDVLEKHEIWHWSVFQETSVETLQSLGFALGIARLINAGVFLAVSENPSLQG
ncbi:hypothetical protein MJO28_012530 [Puccinia striiformis f. sp. tritici]|uniref:Uncharacterized protein n=1 Tax=Puccinia striiformis f. sp. tritici TaxID=168172 RepID=A0ACC0E090_9BASI|nr:hypothetical protein MJO28_012530 [Puccinia striiformis f. sp. tritici]